MSHRETFSEDYEFSVGKTYGGGYSVSLPHQCDNWEILGADVDKDESNDGDYPAHPKDKKLAVAMMELFVQRATEALEKLKQLP